MGCFTQFSLTNFMKLVSLDKKTKAEMGLNMTPIPLLSKPTQNDNRARELSLTHIHLPLPSLPMLGGHS